MPTRISPQDYFSLQEEGNNKILLYLGLIIMGIVACVAITAIALRGGKNV